MKKGISGIRGVVGSDLNLKDVMGFCDSFAALAGSECVLARDTRPSGRMVGDAAAASLMQNGIDVHDLGVSPTPVALRESRRIGAALCVTASHNPLEWNGLKFALWGRGVNARETDAIIRGRGRRGGGIGSYRAAGSSYADELAGLVGRVGGRPDVVVDVGGGAAAGIAPAILRGVGCRVRAINTAASGSSRGPDPTVGRLDDLAEGTRSADIGLALDLDGDRLVIVREGRKLSPDTTLALGVSWALGRGHSRFVLSQDTSAAVESIILEGGGSVTRSKVGEANVVEAMLKTGAQAGGEGSSGGFILPEFNLCRDGMLSGCIAASMLGGPELDAAVSLVESYHRIRDKVSIGTPRHGAALGRAAGWMERECSEVSYLDGVKGIAGDGDWILVRPSNTEDVVRVSAESGDPGRARRMADGVKEAMLAA